MYLKASWTSSLHIHHHFIARSEQFPLFSRVGKYRQKEEGRGGGSECRTSGMSNGHRESGVQNVEQEENLFIETEVSVRTVGGLSDVVWSARVSLYPEMKNNGKVQQVKPYVAWEKGGEESPRVELGSTGRAVYVLLKACIELSRWRLISWQVTASLCKCVDGGGGKNGKMVWPIHVCASSSGQLTSRALRRPGCSKSVVVS